MSQKTKAAEKRRTPNERLGWWITLDCGAVPPLWFLVFSNPIGELQCDPLPLPTSEEQLEPVEPL
jgi:hypothetical protein